MARIDEKRMFEVRVVRTRQGRARKHRVLSCMVTAGSEHEAVVLARAWARFDAVLRVTAVTPVMVKGEVDSLTNAEWALARAEGYDAVLAERDAARPAKAGFAEWETVAKRLEEENAKLAVLLD